MSKQFALTIRSGCVGLYPCSPGEKPGPKLFKEASRELVIPRLKPGRYPVTVSTSSPSKSPKGFGDILLRLQGGLWLGEQKPEIFVQTPVGNFRIQVVLPWGDPRLELYFTPVKSVVPRQQQEV